MTHRVIQNNPRRAQRGLSLVELMVGITVGLFVVAATAALVSNQLGDNRRLMLQTQVQQDLRATMDIIARQLRRAGASTSATVEAGIAASPSAGGASSPFAVMTPTDAPASETGFSFYFDASQQGPYGFKLDGGVVKTLIPRVVVAGGTWQDLTDASTLVVDSFSITPAKHPSANRLPCPKLCADGTDSCWPELVVRTFVVEIKAHAKSDPGVARGLRNEVRVRNDMVQFNGPAVCPT